MEPKGLKYHNALRELANAHGVDGSGTTPTLEQRLSRALKMNLYWIRDFLGFDPGRAQADAQVQGEPSYRKPSGGAPEDVRRGPGLRRSSARAVKKGDGDRVIYGWSFRGYRR